MPSPKQVLVSVLGLGLTVTALTFAAPPAQANVTTTIASFPYTQNWSDTGLITANDDWSNVVGVQGYLGDDASTTAAGIDPRTILTDQSATTDVVNDALVTSTAGGVLEISGDTIAMQGSGTADYPNLVFHLNLTGKSDANFAFDAKDLDAGADNTNQQVNVQYRVGNSADTPT